MLAVDDNSIQRQRQYRKQFENVENDKTLTKNDKRYQLYKKIPSNGRYIKIDFTVAKFINTNISMNLLF